MHLTFLFLVLATTPLLAQQNPVPAKESMAKAKRAGNAKARMQAQLQEMQQAVGLSDEQTEQIATILRENQQKIRELRQQGDREATKEQAKALRKARETAIKGLLSEPQLAKFKAYRKAKADARRQAGGRPPVSGRPSPGNN